MTVNSRETRRTRPLILCRLATAKQPAFSVISEYRRNERRDTLARFDSREGTLFRFVVLASRYFRDSFNASESVAPQSVKKKQRLAKIPPPPVTLLSFRCLFFHRSSSLRFYRHSGFSRLIFSDIFSRLAITTRVTRLKLNFSADICR